MSYDFFIYTDELPFDIVIKVSTSELTATIVRAAGLSSPPIPSVTTPCQLSLSSSTSSTSSPAIPAPLLPKNILQPIPTNTPSRIKKRDEDDYPDEKKENDPSGKEPEPSHPEQQPTNNSPTLGEPASTTTDAQGKTIIVNITTVIIAPSPDPNRVVHDNDTYAQQQDNPNGNNNNNVGDPNDDDTIAEQLEQDQAALKRMVTILSVVGGVGAIAVVATIVIFTRLRVKKRKQRELELEEAELRDDERHPNKSNTLQQQRTSSSNDDDDNYQNDDDDDDDDDHTALSQQRQRPRHNDDNDDTLDVSMERQDGPIPSAPPAPSFLEDQQPRRRNIISMVTSQNAAPAPSAPTAKELDAAADHAQKDISILNHIPGTSSSHYHPLPHRPPPSSSSSSSSSPKTHRHHRSDDKPSSSTTTTDPYASLTIHTNNHTPLRPPPPPSTSNTAPTTMSTTSTACPHCEHHHHHHHHHHPSHHHHSPMDPPELPPPAYTPSAPPLYALPESPILPTRRHSQG
ncbi:hypothetical protein BDA99DRAFT_573337 [Phascolomyces articulosus]|uniref:Uncharacterized protein n=1 Tax=Phascolomyces articulosus TaxID=60185 RepID=A0AAD5K738_9FUNG|nr:hypothetical protein BDA99DRAFT_573337 [Phascolomyces articulosus]